MGVYIDSISLKKERLTSVEYKSEYTIEDFSLMIYDTFVMDMHYPRQLIFSRNKELFQSVSFYKGAVKMLIESIREKIFPRDTASSKELYELVKQFKTEMLKNVKLKPYYGLPFEVAAHMCDDVSDLLQAMI